VWTVSAVVLALTVILISLLVIRLSRDKPTTYRQEKQKPVSVPYAPAEGGAVALIIDDMGHSRSAALPFLELDVPLALSFLPGRPYSAQLAEEGFARGKTILLHFPMEPKGYPGINPGKGAVLTSHDSDEIRRILKEDLRSVPHAIGLNNHMGSLATENGRVMTDVLEFVRDEGLLFIDSRTTPRSVAYRIAKDLNISSAERDIFLDNERDEDAIYARVTQLLDLAEARGWAIGIGHPYPETARVLERAVQDAERRGIQWVSLQEIVRHADPGN
jgi:uncharacterized protein